MPLTFYLNWSDDPVLGAETWFLVIIRLIRQGCAWLKKMSVQTYCYLHLWIETPQVCHPRNMLWLTWNCQESDQILPPVLRVKGSRDTNSSCCPVSGEVPNVAVPASAVEGQVKTGANLPSLHPSWWCKKTCKLVWNTEYEGLFQYLLFKVWHLNSFFYFLGRRERAKELGFIIN